MSVVKVKPDAYTKDTDLKNLCAYIVNPEKTLGGYYTFGRGTEPESAFEDFCEVQELYGKTGGHRAYHIIVSFDEKFAFDAQDGMTIAHQISEFFYPDYQVVCGVHVNQGNLHAHFAVNAVSMNPGITRKLHISPECLCEMRKKADAIEKYCFETE